MKAYQIKIELKGSKPLIWRRVIVPADITFLRLHDTIQLAMGWWDCHLHEFRFPKSKTRVTCDEESYEEWKYYYKKYKNNSPSREEDPYGMIARIMEEEVKNSASTKIDKYIAEHMIFEYVYDFGDNWRHKITLEAVVDDYSVGYPQVLKGKGACPPEDVGGIYGYHDFLEIWKDPTHPEYKSTKEWGEEMQYREFSIDAVNEDMKYLLQLKRVKK